MEALTRNRPSDHQVIREFYISKEPVVLTERQEQVRRHYLEIKAMLLDAKPSIDIVEVMTKDYDISESTCYRYIQNVKALFGELNKADHAFIRYFLWEKGLEVFNLAKEHGKVKDVIQAYANLQKLAPEDRGDMPDWDKLKQGLYPIVLDEVVRDLLTKLIDNPGKTDLTALMNQLGEVEDAEITE